MLRIYCKSAGKLHNINIKYYLVKNINEGIEMINCLMGKNKTSWRDIYLQGKRSQYRVSTNGDVKDKITGKSLDQCSNRNGSLYVILEHKGVIHKIRVHQLVARTFIPNPEGWICVRHIDGNKTNNNVNNLEWDIARGSR
jgi:hypothetical protein